MEIYKQRYYQVVQAKEVARIETRETYQGKAAKLREIEGILSQHRRNLDEGVSGLDSIPSCSFE